MNWGNHGNGNEKWNVDHIKPLVAFNLHDLKEQELAFHYTNLRPLVKEENIKKSDDITDWAAAQKFEFLADYIMRFKSVKS